METKLAYLEIIQSVINRMSSNSFQLKSWSVVLVSALFALAADDSQELFVYLAYFPSAAFWVLDAYYLRQERLFRRLYDQARVLGESSIDFSMDTRPYENSVDSWFEVVFSKTLLIFHGIVFGAIVVVMFVIILTHG